MFRYTNKTTRYTLLILLFCVFPHFLHAAQQTQVTVNWNTNPAEEVVAGYKLYYGNSPGVCGGSVIDIPVTRSGFDQANPSYTFSDLEEGTWYFTLSAYNALGSSSCAEETSKVVGTTPQPTIPPDRDNEENKSNDDNVSMRISNTVARADGKVFIKETNGIADIVISEPGTGKQIVEWLISETQSTKPAPKAPGWVSTKPSTFRVSSPDGPKVIYGWFKYESGEISSTPATVTVHRDTKFDGAARIH